MSISRRTLLARLGASAAVTVAAPRLTADALGRTVGGALPDTIPSGAPIRLNRNENAYGPSAAVIATMRDTVLHAAGRYPDVESESLQRKIAGLHAVAPEQVVLGSGSGEILRAAIDAFVGSQKTLMAAVPTFELLAGCAQRAGAQIVGVALNREYSHDVTAMLARITPETGLIYICNPHNPTGTLTRRHELEGFLRALPATTFVLIDEAYHHYAGESSDYVSFIDRPVDHSRVIVTRSFSKVYGLAGVRVGYAVAAPQTARLLAHRLSDAVNVVAARAAAAALDDTEHVRTSVIRNADDKQEFFNQAFARMLRPIDSLTNFVMFNTGRPAAEVVEHFQKHGVLVAGPIPAFDMAVRVSLGTPADMREFWRVWDLLPGHTMAH